MIVQMGVPGAGIVVTEAGGDHALGVQGPHTIEPAAGEQIVLLQVRQCVFDRCLVDRLDALLHGLIGHCPEHRDGLRRRERQIESGHGLLALARLGLDVSGELFPAAGVSTAVVFTEESCGDTIAQSPCFIRGEFLLAGAVQLFLKATIDRLLQAGFGLIVLVVRAAQLLLLTFFKHLRRGVNPQTEEASHLLFSNRVIQAQTGGSGAFPNPFGVAGGEVVVTHLLALVGAFIPEGYGVRVVRVAITRGELVKGEHGAKIADSGLSYQVCKRCEENQRSPGSSEARTGSRSQGCGGCPRQRSSDSAFMSRGCAHEKRVWSSIHE